MEQPLTTYIMYEIVCLDSNIGYNYVGSTKNFRARKCKHKRLCWDTKNRGYNYKLYSFIRDNGGWDSWEMKPLEELVCDNKIQARIREQYWIDLKEAKLNDKKAHITKEQKISKDKIRNAQYRNENLNTIKQKWAESYNKNKALISERNKIKFKCECGSILRITDKAHHAKTLKHTAFITNIQ